ncbi:MAG: hypothetical protein IAF38_07650 [Bacteroidia bacterium]|nr:hypothetical protein [Bacteroidia bacterium]
MRKLIGTILLIAGCFTVTLAQGPQDQKEKGKRGEKLLKEMTTTLSLTTDQQNKIKPIIEETGKTMKTNREKYKGNQKCMRQSAFQTRKASEEKIMAILTPDQQKKFTEEKNKKQEERKKKRQEKLMEPIDCK